MARIIPPCPPEIQNHSSGQLFENPLDIHVVTPLFGGGVSAGKNDPVTVIRGTTVRGHLRFWWRATRGATFSTVEALKKREYEIWGSASSPGQVSLRIKIVSKGQSNIWGEFPPDKNYFRPKPGFPAYALFPFTGKKEQGVIKEQPASFQIGINFQLEMSIRDLSQKAEISKEVEAALWAWINFGGVGARTRRGCGSLYCEKFSPSLNEAPNQQDKSKINNWYKNSLSKYEISLNQTPPPLWTCLPVAGALLTDSVLLSPMQSWNRIIGHLQFFRQGKNFARNPGEQTPGRSRWPEAESIRQITGQRSNNHARQPEIAVPFFPRAAFGLPIVFHFKDRYEPTDTQLEPLGSASRMSSPVILKALAISRDKAVWVALFLNKPPLPGVKLVNTGFQATTKEAIVNPQILQYKNSPLLQPGLQNEQQNFMVIPAFLNYLKQKRGQ